MNSHAFSRRAISLAAVLLGFTTFAHAGPPLICRAIAIGQAKTLPWVELNYQKGSGGYDLENLTRDTLAILDSNPSVLVRMETLRRATIYARQDPQVAKELLTRFLARAANSDAGNPGALAWFDAGYLAETYKQWMGEGEPNPAKSLDGYGLVRRAISPARIGSGDGIRHCSHHFHRFGARSQRSCRESDGGCKNRSSSRAELASYFNRRTIAETLAYRPAKELRKMTSRLRMFPGEPKFRLSAPRFVVCRVSFHSAPQRPEVTEM